MFCQLYLWNTCSIQKCIHLDFLGRSSAIYSSARLVLNYPLWEFVWEHVWSKIQRQFNFSMWRQNSNTGHRNELGINRSSVFSKFGELQVGVFFVVMPAFFWTTHLHAFVQKKFWNKLCVTQLQVLFGIRFQAWDARLYSKLATKTIKKYIENKTAKSPLHIFDIFMQSFSAVYALYIKISQVPVIHTQTSGDSTSQLRSNEIGAANQFQ